MRKMLLAATAVLCVLVAAPAWAHEEISPKIIGTGTPTFFTLSAANEKTSDLTRVVLTAPSGSVHRETWSAEGCELVIECSPDDALLRS